MDNRSARQIADLRCYKQEPEEDCRATSETLGRIRDKWTVLVVELLAGGPMRFNELLHTIKNISQRMLTLTLRGLERDGLATRTVYPTIPPRVDYELTKLGRTLRDPLTAVADWTRKHRPAILEARKVFDAGGTARPSHRREPRRAPALLPTPRLSRSG
jgi:DNA-binding HxlR family transcriptional regulator